MVPFHLVAGSGDDLLSCGCDIWRSHVRLESPIAAGEGEAEYNQAGK